MRAQLNLPSLGVALLLVTAAAGVGLAVADGAFESADRDPVASHAATALADRLVAADGPLAVRGSVLDADAVRALNASRLRSLVPWSDGRDVAVSLDGEVLARTGPVTGGRTVRRLVLVAETTPRTLTPALGTDRTLTVPRRTDRLVVELDPPADTTVRAVRVNGRTVLLNESGLRGRFVLDASRFRTADLAFDATGRLPAGSVRVTYDAERTTKGVLVVRVDA